MAKRKGTNEPRGWIVKEEPLSMNDCLSVGRCEPAYTRRQFAQHGLTAIGGTTFAAAFFPQLTGADEVTPRRSEELPGIIDTNVYVGDWPFRPLKYARPDALQAKLQRHRIKQAWVGSFDGVWHKQIDQANRRLVDVCRAIGDGFFVPIGTVNPAWPDWREDLRRCHENYRMSGIRLYPSYHGYTFGHEEFRALWAECQRRGLWIQVAMRLEDDRVHHPATVPLTIDVLPLIELLEETPQARVQLLQADATLRGPVAARLIRLRNVVWDISSLEGDAGLRCLFDGEHPYYRGPISYQRFVFGSHAPLFPSESAVWKLFESPLSHDELRGVMYENIERWIRDSHG